MCWGVMEGWGSLPDIISSTSQRCALQPSNHRASPRPGEGSPGLLHLPEQPGVEIPVMEKRMSDNTPGTALPKAADNAFGKE